MKKERLKMILDNIYYFAENAKYRKAIIEVKKAGEFLIEQLNTKTRKGEKKDENKLFD